jgi:WS/DGAT/MGAT family acyltransferase
MVDGVAATDLMSVMFGDDAEPEPEEEWRPGPEPSDVAVFVRGAYHRARHPAQQASVAVRARTELLRGTVRMMRAVAAAAPTLRPSRSSLTGPIGPHRVWSWASARLSDVKDVRSGLGGTVNDVVLAIVTNGFRDLLVERGEEISPRRTVRTMVPVSVRLPGERGVYNNRVSAVFARLPVGIDDPTERLALIRDEMDDIKESGQAVAGDVLVQLSGFAPPLLLALGSRVATRSAHFNMDTATTNVPGPQRPVHAVGRRLLESYPYVPIAGTIRIVVAIFSYDGGLYFGVTGDRDHAADIGVLTAGIESGLASLRERAAATAPA